MRLRLTIDLVYPDSVDEGLTRAELTKLAVELATSDRTVMWGPDGSQGPDEVSAGIELVTEIPLIQRSDM